MKTRVIISVTNEISYDQRMLKTATTLVNNGFTVRIIGRNKEEKNDYPPQPGDIEFHRFSLFFNKGKFFYLEYNLRLLFYLIFNFADIYCAVDLDTILPNLLVSRLKGKPLIYDAHEYFTEVPELQGRGLEKAIWKWVERLAIPLCDKIYTVSDGIASLFSKEYFKEVEVIQNLPRKFTRDTQSRKENIILYQGDLNEGRGLELAIKAMDSLENYTLWIAGGGYFEFELKSLALKNRHPERIIFLGKLSPMDLKNKTLSAKFGLNLLENKGLNYYNSLANKFFDYLQSGVIPISMNFPEYSALNERYHCALLIDSLDIHQFINTLELAEKNYPNLLKNVDIAASFLTWESEEEKLCSIYKNV
ncbi:MAG: glycosyltransferase [Chitinophagales bacterium]|nr:glycosyltransferase [Chitinophagales bacterium]